MKHIACIRDDAWSASISPPPVPQCASWSDDVSPLDKPHSVCIKTWGRLSPEASLYSCCFT